MADDPTFSDSVVLDTLVRLNPWWRASAAASGVPARRVPAWRRPGYWQVLPYAFGRSARQALLLLGPRQVGKTTALYQAANALMRSGETVPVCFIDFAVPVLRSRHLGQLLELADQVLGHPERALVLLDEAHLGQDWSAWLRTELDHRPGFRFLATGSAAAILREEGAESGVGRWDEAFLPTLLLPEFIALRGQEAPRLAVFGLGAPTDPEAYWRAYLIHRQELGQIVRDYLVCGGFPESARTLEWEDAQRSLREDVLEKVLGRDMTTIFKVAHTDAMEQLFVSLALNTGGLVNVDAMSKHLKLSRQVVGNYIHHLVRAFLVIEARPVGLGAGPMLRTQSKVYVADASLRNAVLFRGSEEILRDPKDMGRVVENAVATHLHALATVKGGQLGYWPGRKGTDAVDFVVCVPGHPPVAVEVKHQGTLGASDFAGLLAFKEAVPESVAILLCDGNRIGAPERTPAGVHLLPTDGFLFSVGSWVIDEAKSRAERLLDPILASEV